ncbi:MAG: viroplasmin family protein [Bacteroidetes bacterium]|nr:viroplasmin family protein [Bacteroidota bacterium]
MSKVKKQYYVVWSGKKPGIYDTWDKCKQQVDGFNMARYKGFASLEEATIALAGNPFEYISKKAATPASTISNRFVGKPEKVCLCVDAACSGNPGVLEYRGVYLPSGEAVFHRGPFPQGTTNIGEFLAIVTGLAWLKQRNLTIPLYSDSRNGIIWVKQKRINTKLARTAKNEDLFLVIEKALEWLHNNSFENKVLKWETAAWGEIPADFGRK